MELPGLYSGPLRPPLADLIAAQTKRAQEYPTTDGSNGRLNGTRQVREGQDSPSFPTTEIRIRISPEHISTTCPVNRLGDKSL